MTFSKGQTSQNGGDQSSHATTDLDPEKGVVKTDSNNGQEVPNYQAKEADVQVLVDLTRVLDKKKALLSELKHMNDDIEENRRNGYNDLENSMHFRKQYAAVMVQLNRVNGEVSSSLLSLRQRNSASLSLNDIIESSRAKARKLVEETIQEMLSSLNRGKNNDSQISSELITNCVATVIMIQKCSEEQFPLYNVDQILESAVTSLKPSCSENLPIYCEIQNCMRIIRNQILARKLG